MGKTTSLFVNISNHPSQEWGEAQKSAARELGRQIADIPFPPVPPLATHGDILALAQSVADQLQALAAGSPVVAHVMGELTLSYALVSLLKSRGVRCVASTSERIVEILPDGRKAAAFRFAAFREY